MAKKDKKKISSLLIILIVTPLFLLAGFYIYTLTKEERKEIETIQEITEEETPLLQVDEIEVEEIEEEELNIFYNISYDYSVNYQKEWELDSDDLERVWFSVNENASLLFASDSATQTGFPEYDLVESIDINIDGVEASVAVLHYLEDNTKRSLLTFFETDIYPHFVMLSYSFENEEQEKEIFDLNEEFLKSIKLGE